MEELRPGSVFAGHRIAAVAGRGGMGVVYRARNLILDRDRALKLIAPELSRDNAFRRRFERESRLAASIDHPNVIPIHHAGDEDGVLYVAMRYVDGADLGRLVEERGRLDPPRAIRILAQIANALDAAHAHGLVHRDIKPDNVLLEGAGGEEHAYLTDFGLSKLATSGSTLTASGAFVGTVDYVAPEQVEGSGVGPAADVYALGCVLYQALTGEVPFPRDTQLSKMFAHANAERPVASEVAPELPRAVDDVLRRAMAVDPAERHPSAGALIGAAAEAVGSGGGPARTVVPQAASTRVEQSGGGANRTARLHRSGAGRQRRTIVAAAATVAILAVAGLVATLVTDDARREPDASGPPVTTGEPIAVGDAPTRVAVGDGTVWVTNRDDDSVSRIDASSGRTLGRPIRVGDEPTGIAVGAGDALWVANDGEGTVSHVDGRTGRTLEEIRVGMDPSDVAIGEGAVWVVNELDATVSRIDPGRERVEATIPVGTGPRAVAVGEGLVWVANIDDDTVSKIDPASNDTVGRPIPVGGRPSEVAVGEGAVWTSNNLDGTVSRIDPAAAEPAPESIEVGTKPRGVAVGEGFVWVANGGEGTVSRIDPSSGAVVGEPIAVGADPADVAVGEGAVWIVNQGDATAQPIRP